MRRRERLERIEPALFNFIRDYASEVVDAAQKRPVPNVALGPLTVFVENFFGQFFRSELHTSITDFSESSQERAAKMRIERESGAGADEVTALISSFETYCRL